MGNRQICFKSLSSSPSAANDTSLSCLRYLGDDFHPEPKSVLPGSLQLWSLAFVIRQGSLAGFRLDDSAIQRLEVMFQLNQSRKPNSS
jgi:hypothetical protein